jgi:hypothetical protein
MADCRTFVRETTLQSSQPIPSLEVGGEELFPESAVTRLVELVISPSWQRVGCLVALLSQRWRWMVPTSGYANFWQIFGKMRFDHNSLDEGKA